ncbi:hypothetical protein [Streptomyces sp. NPDC001250]|uniref:hypothetical protein n=1 Tax=unclassified Streptomyces TaxID=2593676 RepID=UPI00331A5E68
MDIRSAQKLAWDNKIDKGFNATDVSLESNLLTAEIGEAFTAWRKGILWTVFTHLVTPPRTGGRDRGGSAAGRRGTGAMAGRSLAEDGRHRALILAGQGPVRLLTSGICGGLRAAGEGVQAVDLGEAGPVVHAAGGGAVPLRIPLECVVVDEQDRLACAQHFAGPAVHRTLTASGMPTWIREHPYTVAAPPTPSSWSLWAC